MFFPPDRLAYYQVVYAVVRRIPPGRVATYREVAACIAPPPGVEPPQYDRLGARWVGRALRETPAGLDIPWHRVINRHGRISLPAGSPEASEQRARLEAEGVSFDATGRIDRRRFGWDGCGG